jgi:hypothetical protein
MLPEISKLFPREKVYEDMLRPAAQELGESFGNVVKTARFLLAPFDYLASQQDRFQKYLKRIAEKVPQENLTEAPPQLVGKILESLRYLDDDSILTEMYINLLSVSVDKTRNSLAHPAFPIILSALCRDEAIIIHFLKIEKYKLVEYIQFDNDKKIFNNAQYIKNTFPVNILDFPDNFIVYLNHLHSLNVAGIWQDGNQVPKIVNGIQIGVTINSVITFQRFGEMLAEACVVDDITKFGVSL